MVSKEPDAGKQTDEFAHIEHDANSKGSSAGAKQIDAANASILSDGVEEKVENLAGKSERGADKDRIEGLGFKGGVRG